MKYVVGVILASLSLFTYAQNTPLACQEERSSGLRWDGEKWNPAELVTRRFILSLSNNKLTTESVIKALDVPQSGVECKENIFELQICNSEYGKSLYFSIKNNKGAISSITRGPLNNDFSSRPALWVSAFTCTPF